MIKDLDIGNVIETFGDWVVTDYGVECLVDYYPIEKDRIKEQRDVDDWVRQIQGKIIFDSVQKRDFVKALNFCRSFWSNGTWRMRFEVFKRDGFKCVFCGRSAKDGVKLEVDHILPRSLGGNNHMDNYQTLCRDCNLGKSNNMEDSNG